MKNTARILSVLLVVFTLVSLIGSFGVSAETKVPNYDKAALGELLYTADFTGSDGILNIDDSKIAAEHKWTVINHTVDAADSKKVSVVKTKAINEAFGGDIDSLPLTSSTIYTYTLTITRTGNTPVAVLVDGIYGGYFWANKARVQRNGSKVLEANFPADVLGTSPSAEAPSTQECAIEVDGTKTTISLYVKDKNAKWAFIASSAIKDSDPFFNYDGTSEQNQVLGVYVYAYHVTDVTVSNVQIYKGLIASETYPEIIVPPQTGDGFMFIVGAALVSVGGIVIAVKSKKKED